MAEHAIAAGVEKLARFASTGETTMNKTIVGLALLFLIAGPSTGAHAGAWCAFYDSSTYNCGFHSYAQCYETIFGNGGWCRQNFFEPSSQGRRSKSRS
jgi:hypothetical protein